MKKMLIIGLVWPEPTSSAAGTRMLQLIDLFQSKNYEITFACAATKSDFSYPLQSKNVKEVEIQLNNESFNAFVKDLNPDYVMFDRYMVEEQYGWRVSIECPQAIKILDTEDLHFLRYARQEAVKKGVEFSNQLLYTDHAKREIASILRSDITLLISSEEKDLLINQFNINPSLLYYLPFIENEISSAKISSWNSFEDREHFMFIGNFIHEPNWNCVQVLKNRIWPLIKKALPKAELHIYGAYASQKVNQLHNSKERFFIKGRAEDAQQTMAGYKVLLAPIQFGAGVKGKFIDAMQTGTPNVTTKVGAEAMQNGLDWNGFITFSDEDFANKAINLYQNKELWKSAQHNGVKILNTNYGDEEIKNQFWEYIKDIQENLDTHRQQNFYGQILQHHSNQSTKYMSLWIEQKNKNNSN
ncbi:glycosyltransferase [Faecalibacter bovis]|uniref:Glycosyltransferase family 4 protein n=1 Tax=Faecalibacter bovis TaxID=2898187 RepID=A0ABX7XDJ5_9FLAO|nr:glycosyltransferase [Faecalibacter bovis]QTV05837.1 glycosyltransferase family 4 protein [Faecalibacter bovis]